MNIDQEVEEFLHNERRVFEETSREVPSGLNQEKSRNRKGKGKIESMETGERLKRKYEEKGKEIRIACHNINGLKTRGWKLENLLGWAKEEEITILRITETNIAEKKGKILVHRYNTQYKGYWTSAMSDKKKGSGIGILIDERWEKHVG